MNYYMLMVIFFVLSVFSIGLKIYLNPGKVNSTFGYSSQRSILTEDTWYEANRYAGRSLMRFSTVSLLLFSLIGSFFSNIQHVFLVLASCFFIFLLSVVFLTEKHLKQVFLKNGKRRPTAL